MVLIQVGSGKKGPDPTIHYQTLIIIGFFTVHSCKKATNICCHNESVLLYSSLMLKSKCLLVALYIY